MDEAGTGEGGGNEAEQRLAHMVREWQMFVRTESACLLARSKSIEVDLRWYRRRKWVARGLALFNAAVCCSCIASWPGWMAALAPVAGWSAWKALWLARLIETDLNELEASWASAREQIKTIERMASES